ncbi:MAG TPA: hypothetical protein VHY20_12240, partial [Pirellulales bacterium]|nr:hypothetical protein [Pirellulales bacterium]
NCAAVYINDRLIVAFKGFPPQGLSQLGFHGESNDQLCVWQFSDFSVRKPELDDVALLIPATLADDVLFADDFATLDPAWGDADGVQSIADGMLVLEPSAGTSYASLYQGALFDDADLRVKISETSGGKDQPAGLIFWATDYQNYYVAQIVPGGSSGISRIKDGQWTAPAPYVPGETTNLAAGKTSALRVVLRGDSATFFVNDRQIAALKGEPPKGDSKIGVRAASGGSVKYHWQFDELVVRTVE